MHGMKNNSAEEQQKINCTLDQMVTKLGNLDKKLNCHHKIRKECFKVGFEQILDKLKEIE